VKALPGRSLYCSMKEVCRDGLICSLGRICQFFQSKKDLMHRPTIERGRQAFTEPTMFRQLLRLESNPKRQHV
jgi:hypothetical protein